MSPSDFYSQIRKHTQGYEHCYAMLDCARDEQIYTAISQSENPSACLYRLDVGAELIAVSPHLVELSDNDFSHFLYEKGWGNGWGFYIASNYSLDELVQHFRRIAKVQLADMRSVLFRYEDPRIMSDFLPTSNREQLELVIGQAGAFVIEDETIVNEITPDTATKYEIGDFGLITQVVPLDSVVTISQAPPPEVKIWSKTSTLKISQTQLQVLSRTAKHTFIRNVISEFRDSHRTQLSGLDDQTLRENTDQAMTAFHQLGFTKRGDFRAFMEVCINIGWDFWDNASRWAVSDYLGSQRFASTQAALGALLEVSRQLDVEAIA